MDVKCFRCGTCCKGFIALVPKTLESNLSESFLEQYGEENGFDAMFEYVESNSEPQGDRCKWLEDNSDGTTTCTAYERRGSDCSNYPEQLIFDYCRVGKKFYTAT